MSNNLSKHTKFKEDVQLYKRLLGYAWPYRGLFGISIIGFMLYAALDVLAADLMQYLIDSMGGTPLVNTEHKTGLITSFLRTYLDIDTSDSVQARIVIPTLLVLLAIMRGVGALVGNYYIKYIGSRVVYDLRQLMFRQMMHLPTSYILAHSSGNLINRITYSVSQITTAVTSAIAVLFREGLTVIFLFSYLIYINWKLTLTFLVVAPIIAFIVRTVSQRFRRLSKKLQTSMGDVTHVVSEAVTGNRDMRIYGAQESEVDRFGRVNEKTLRQQLKIAIADAAFSPVIQILLSTAIAILVWLGLNPSIIESMSPGLFVSYLIAAGVIGKPLRQLTEVINTIQKALAAAEEVFDTLDEPIEIETGTKTMARAKGDICFDNVSFRYPNVKENALTDISFSAKAGQMVALVGASGGGKSTLANLIPRFFEIETGTIYIDDVAINELTLKSLRQQIAFVSQNVVLMNASVRSNIAYGEMADKTDEEIIQAAKLANAHEFISKMDEGYDTLIGDNGLRLSGGQRQRLAIARAILKGAPILIMDEATSALDNESERLIQSAMQNIAGSCTHIVIAHRLSTIERADLILVIDQGKIVERGNHQELLAKQGVYAQLHDKYQEQDMAQG